MESSSGEDPCEREVFGVLRRRLEAEGMRYFGCPATVRMTRVRQRAYSAVAFLSVHNGARARHIVAKSVMKRALPHDDKLGEITREEEALRLCGEVFRGCKWAVVPGPIASFPDLYALVMEEVPGLALDASIARFRPWRRAGRVGELAFLCGRCGQWLRRFQDATRSVVPVRSLNVTSFCEKEVALLLARPMRPVTKALLEAVRARVRQLAVALEGSQTPVAFAHGDFAPHNVVVSPDGQRIAVIDFARSRIDTIGQDYFRFRTKLEMLGTGLFMTPGAVRRLVGAFDEGYGERLDDEAPLSEILRIGFALDQMSAFVYGVDGPPAPWRWRLLRRWQFYRHALWLRGRCVA